MSGFEPWLGVELGLNQVPLLRSMVKLWDGGVYTGSIYVPNHVEKMYTESFRYAIHDNLLRTSLKFLYPLHYRPKGAIWYLISTG